MGTRQKAFRRKYGLGRQKEIQESGLRNIGRKRGFDLGRRKE